MATNEPQDTRPSAAQARQAEANKREAVRNRQENAARQADEAADRKQATVEETHSRMDNARPTPTQRENDLAKLGGQAGTPLEDDGSGPDPAPDVARRLAGAAAPYSTRDAQADRGHQPARVPPAHPQAHPNPSNEPKNK